MNCLRELKRVQFLTGVYECFITSSSSPFEVSQKFVTATSCGTHSIRDAYPAEAREEAPPFSSSMGGRAEASLHTELFLSLLCCAGEVSGIVDNLAQGNLSVGKSPDP